MSEENVEATKLAVAALNRGDFAGLEELSAPEGEGMDINEDAPVITRDEIVIRAPIETIWEIQTNVDDWPSWQADVHGAESKGPLEVGSVFRWQTAGLDITSTVERWLAPRLAGEPQAHRRAAVGDTSGG